MASVASESERAQEVLLPVDLANGVDEVRSNILKPRINPKRNAVEWNAT